MQIVYDMYPIWSDRREGCEWTENSEIQLIIDDQLFDAEFPGFSSTGGLVETAA